jgi:maltooligosyltrehalose trehalohydrolase
VGEHGLVLERRGPTGTLHVLVNVRGSLEYRPPAGAELVLWSEAPRFGGTSEEAPLRSGVLRLEGPGAAVLRVAG